MRSIIAAGLALVFVVVGATAAEAHGDEADISASELVLTALAILEVHPSPAAAVMDKIADAQESKDPSGVDLALVKQAGEALDRGDVARAKGLLERSVGKCPDPDILFVSDQPAKPPCTVSVHELSQPRKSVGGTSEVVILALAVLLALSGILIVRHRYVRGPEAVA